jgi:glycine cleavage system H protein
MDAGLVNYKLCSSRFECETCPFDTVMREQHQTFAEQAARQSGAYASGRSAAGADAEAGGNRDTEGNTGAQAATSDPIDRLLLPLSDTAFPDDRIYFSNHTWMRPMQDGMFTVGIDRFLAQMLYPVAGIAAVQTPSRIGRSEPYAWIIRDNATLAVLSSEKGTVSRVNSRLMEHPSLVTGDPYGEGWLITLTCSPDSTPGLKFYTADEYRGFIRQELDDLAAELRKNRRSVGTTMFDGGTRIESIEKFIGEKRYTRFITRLLRPH